jgi:hypothetical protein
MVSKVISFGILETKKVVYSRDVVFREMKDVVK